jgi:hypothetical protein
MLFMSTKPAAQKNLGRVLLSIDISGFGRPDLLAAHFPGFGRPGPDLLAAHFLILNI